ncbi:MAG TPA: hypothetical protein VF710_23860 [Longimicrobium sp.]
MNDVIETADALHASANRLYWHSRDSVDALAARLGMSRHAFYQSIRPEPARRACAACGGELEFANRTARQTSRARCAGCGATERVAPPAVQSVVVEDVLPAPPPPPPSARPSFRGWNLSRWRRELAAVPRERAAMVGGAAALGVAAGVLALELLNPSRW